MSEKWAQRDSGEEGREKEGASMPRERTGDEEKIGIGSESEW